MTEDDLKADVLTSIAFQMFESLLLNKGKDSRWPKKIKEWFDECEKSIEKRKMFYSIIYHDWFEESLRKKTIQELSLFEESTKEDVESYWKEKTYKKFLYPVCKELE